jgi:hypothetical protein
MLTPTPQMMLISHSPKLAPATLSAATHPVPKKISSAVPRNSAMHWLESDGCCKAVVIENLVFVFVWRFFIKIEARFSPRQDPHPDLGLLLGTTVKHSHSIRIRKNIDKKR